MNVTNTLETIFALGAIVFGLGAIYYAGQYWLVAKTVPALGNLMMYATFALACAGAARVTQVI